MAAWSPTAAGDARRRPVICRVCVTVLCSLSFFLVILSLSRSFRGIFTFQAPRVAEARGARAPEDVR